MDGNKGEGDFLKIVPLALPFKTFEKENGNNITGEVRRFLMDASGGDAPFDRLVAKV